ncbi:hypothetical protein M231_02139 [Tremella mesenterica]|uniref:Uncharacterized protein n=1 Tax=Tremella mesenterica TaxID=5217 RepID=A0A4V1M4I5_TREME|nr:hypothetical protein M231_02139 [Tremella mesenterica]
MTDSWLVTTPFSLTPQDLEDPNSGSVLTTQACQTHLKCPPNEHKCFMSTDTMDVTGYRLRFTVVPAPKASNATFHIFTSSGENFIQPIMINMSPSDDKWRLTGSFLDQLISDDHNPSFLPQSDYVDILSEGRIILKDRKLVMTGDRSLEQALSLLTGRKLAPMSEITLLERGSVPTRESKPYNTPDGAREWSHCISWLTIEVE